MPSLRSNAPEQTFPKTKELPPPVGREPDLPQAHLDLEQHLRQRPVRDHPHRLQDGLLRRQHARRRPLLPTIMSIGVGGTGSGKLTVTRQRRRADRLFDHLPARPLLRRLSSRIVHDATSRPPAMRVSMGRRRGRLPCQAGSRRVVQHPRRAGDKAAQSPLLPGTPRPGVQTKDGGGPVRLSRGEASRAIMSISATARSACWPGSTC
jgi:hypothetical protein